MSSISLTEKIVCSLRSILTLKKLDSCFRRAVPAPPPSIFQKIWAALFGQQQTDTEHQEISLPQWVNFMAYIVFLCVAIIAYTTIYNVMPKPTANLSQLGSAVNGHPTPSQRSPITRDQQIHAYGLHQD
ncbi:uncharacterized protein [Watersipora subatra]|uniref:uncharacterized protein n=1 Tax=Watersipora subatra TaxID=2589382 RepID=UPI00355AD17C